MPVCFKSMGSGIICCWLQTSIQFKKHFKKNICLYFLSGKTFPLSSNKLFLYLYCERACLVLGVEESLWSSGFPLPSSSCQVRSHAFCFPHPNCFPQWYSSIFRSVLFKNKCFTEWQGICYLLTAYRQGIELLIISILIETTSYLEFCFLPFFPHEEPKISFAVVCFIKRL